MGRSFASAGRNRGFRKTPARMRPAARIGKLQSAKPTRGKNEKTLAMRHARTDFLPSTGYMISKDETRRMCDSGDGCVACKFDLTSLARPRLRTPDESLPSYGRNRGDPWTAGRLKAHAL